MSPHFGTVVRVPLMHHPALHPPNRLLELRYAADLTQGQVAVRLGVSRTTYGRWESRQTPIADRYKLELAALFGVTPAHLMGWGAMAA